MKNAGKNILWGAGRTVTIAAGLAVADALLRAWAGFRIGEGFAAVALDAGRVASFILVAGLALAPIVGLLVAASAGSAAAPRLARRWRRRLLARLPAKRDGTRRSFLAGLVAAVGALACWFTLAVPVARELLVVIQTPWYAATAAVAATCACALAAAMLVPAWWRLGRLLARLPRRLPSVEVQLAILAGLLAAAAVALLAPDWEDFGRHLPWHWPAALLLATVLRCVGGFAARRPAGRRAVVIAGLAVSLALLAAGALALAGNGDAPRQPVAAFEPPPPGRHDYEVRPPPRPMPVILVTVDAAAALRMDLYGAKRQTMPRLAARARSGAAFDRAFSVGPSTRLSFPSLHSGQYVTRIEWAVSERVGAPWRNVERTMASLFAAAGYRTEAVVPDTYFTEVMPWVTTGFQRIDTSAVRGKSGVVPNAELVADAALTRLAELAASDRFLLWVHFSDAHAPYRLPEGLEPFPGGGPGDIYDRELEWVDRHVDRLLDGVDRLLGDRPRVVLLTADHGQAFDAKHEEHHQNHDLSTAVTWIPLVVWSPFSGGRRLDRPAGTVDVLPTLLNATGLRAEDLPGDSLLPDIAGTPRPPRPVLQQLFLPEYVARGKEPLVRVALRDGRHVLHRLIERGDERLYDYVDDPLEERDLLASRPEIAARLRALLDLELARAGWTRRERSQWVVEAGFHPSGLWWFFGQD
jgi:arylsulfatase A-like enzyme